MMKKMWIYLVLSLCISSRSDNNEPSIGGYIYDYNSLHVHEYPSHNQVFYIKDLTRIGTEYWDVYEANSYHQVYYVKLTTRLGPEFYEVIDFGGLKPHYIMEGGKK